MKFHHRICLILLCMASTLMAGCGKKQEEKTATQVAAKVNSTEITVSQINSILARTPNIPPEAVVKAKREILDKLIDQELAKEQSIDQKLDRSPAVMQAVEGAKTEILARAYLERVAAQQPRPTPEEVKKYYADHPELFAQRRVFNIEEIDLAPKQGIGTKLLADEATKGRTMQEIADWLKARNAKFTANRGVRAAEQIPLELLPKLQTMKDGDIQVLEAAGEARQILRVVASKAAPVDEATAAPRIQQFLFNRRSSEVIAKQMKEVKAGAKIEYMGEFASEAAAAAAQAKANEEAKAKAQAAAKAQQEADAKATADAIAKAKKEAETAARLEAEAKAKSAPPKPAQLPQGTLDKGIKGLQ